MCDCAPLDIPEDENIIRAIYYSVHLDSKGRLKWNAYDPTPGTDQVSVMRAGCMEPDGCKRKARELEGPNKLYRGLAVLNAGAVRNSGMDVTDSRREFCGHGHISTGVFVRKREPLEPRDPEEREKVKAIASVLMKLSNYYKDPNPDSDTWTGSLPMVPPSSDQATAMQPV